MPLALLVSGQSARVLPRPFYDSPRLGLRHLFADRAKHCAPSVDVFIALSHGGATFDFTQVLDGGGDPPAMFHGAEDPALISRRLERAYSHLGARRVRIRLIDALVMEQNNSAVEDAVGRYAAARYDIQPATWWQAAKSILNFPMRWRTGRMYLLRFIAFSMARAFQATVSEAYAWYLCMREDNMWLRPPPPLPSPGANASAASQQAPPPPPRAAFPGGFADAVRRFEAGWPGCHAAAGAPLVLVDDECGFGAFSDKIFLANAKGGAALWGANWEAHVEAMARWIELALVPPRDLQTRPREQLVPALVPRKPDVMQTE